MQKYFFTQAGSPSREGDSFHSRFLLLYLPFVTAGPPLSCGWQEALLSEALLSESCSVLDLEALKEWEKEPEYRKISSFEKKHMMYCGIFWNLVFSSVFAFELCNKTCLVALKLCCFEGLGSGQDEIVTLSFNRKE